MKVKRIFSISAVLVIFICMVVPTMANAAEEVFISDIKENPSKYYNLAVEVKGIVTNVTPSQFDVKSGFYTIRDESEDTIEIKTRELPAPGQAFTFVGIVTMDAGSQKPYLKELKRSKGSPLPLIVIIAAVIVLFLVAVLVYLLRKPVGAEQAEPPAATSTPAPTRPVKADELKSSKPEKTVAVPSVPAQVEIANGPNKGEKLILKKENVIGREEGELPLGDLSVSSEHAHIIFKNKKYVLLNKSLTNPTMINNKVVEGTQDLNDGDEMLMGTIKLKFNIL